MKIIVWKLLDTLHVGDILSYIKKAKRNRILSKPVIIHSNHDCNMCQKIIKTPLVSILFEVTHIKVTPEITLVLNPFML